MDRLYIGIDVSKDRLDVHVLPTAESFFVARTGAGLGELIAKLRNFGVAAAIAVEATGGFERIVAAGLASANLPVVIVNPAQVRDFAKALGRSDRRTCDCALCRGDEAAAAAHARRSHAIAGRSCRQTASDSPDDWRRKPA
jgi:transposase